MEHMKYSLGIGGICVLLVSCGYHFNAFDPQLEPPKEQPSGLTDGAGSDGLVEDVTSSADIAGPGLDAGSDLSGEAAEHDDAGQLELVEEVEVAGCTDPDALNYDPQATTDDGSCLKNVLVTFELDMSCYKNTVAPQVAGGETFGMPGDNPMSDPDGDDVWSVTIELPPMLSSSYTYTSDICDDWNCKENISGQDCAVPPYNDRSLNTGTEDHSIEACFSKCGEGHCGQCPVDAPEPMGKESCGESLIKVDFFVDMTGAWAVAQDNVVALQGSFDTFYPGLVMARVSGTKLFRVAVCLEKNTDYTFKYASYEYTNDANEFPDGLYATDATPCPGGTETFDCQFGTCTERLLSTGSADMALDVLPWGGCDGYPFE